MTRAAGKASAVRVRRPPRGGTGERAAARGGTGTRAAARDTTVRPARPADLDAVIAIDRTVTGIEKRDYWRSVFRRYAGNGKAGRQFLVAEAAGRVAGFVIGDVRDWEFGSPPCGWVFGIDVRPDMRLAGVGTRLLAAICERFRDSGVQTVRTMLARDNTLVLSFFRSQGMMAGPFIPLEMDLRDAGQAPAHPARSGRSR